MAKLVEEVLVIKLSKLVRDKDANDTVLVNDEFIENLEVVAGEIASDSGVVVEVIRADDT